MAPFQFLIIVRVPIVSVSVLMVTLPEANTAMATMEDVHVASSVHTDQACNVESVDQFDCLINPSTGLIQPIPPSSSGIVLWIFAVTATTKLLHATADVIRAWRDQDRDP